MPDYVFDLHTVTGRKTKLTQKEFLWRENAALITKANRENILYDDLLKANINKILR